MTENLRRVERSRAAGRRRRLAVATLVSLLALPPVAADAADLVVRLRAEPGSDFSRYRVRVDGEVVADARVSSKSWVEVRHPVAPARLARAEKIGVEHYYDTRSRQLHVDRISVDGRVIPAAAGVQDAGPQDGKLLRTGSKAGIFPWNGVLYFDLGDAGADVGRGEEPAAEPEPAAGPEPVVAEGPRTPVAKGGGGAYFRPPAPLAKLRVVQLSASGNQKVSGGGDEDLLLVSPPGVIDGQFRLEVNGFRGVYWIGATFDPQPTGTLVSPNGKTVRGVGALVKIRTHANAVGRPFIYLDRMRLKTGKIAFGDFLQLGGAARAGDWGDWPDVYRCRMIADPLYGWTGYRGGSFSKYVSHSDFTKFEMGGVRDSYAAMIDVTWGYQGEYVLPSWAAGKRPYKGPDGYGTAQYWDYVGRVVSDRSIGAKDSPKAFFLARGSDEVAAGNHITHAFHTRGKGVFVVPLGAKGSAASAIHPGGGAYAPQDFGTHLLWRNPGGHPFVTGRLENGARRSVPRMVSESEVGFRHRVTDRAQLTTAAARGCGR